MHVRYAYLFLNNVENHENRTLILKKGHKNKPDPPDSILDEPIESISSMKIIDGACSL